MPYQVTLSAADRNVVMPNGLRYPGGSTVVLSDAEYAQLSPTFLASFVTASSPSFMARVAATPTAGFTLVNGTPTILSWTAPNDGQVHRVLIESLLVVTSTATGGAITLSATDPTGGAHGYSLISANQGTGGQRGTVTFIAVQAGSTTTVTQSSALTAGAAALFAEIWGS